MSWKNVWQASGTIAKGTVIGAGSVVTKDIPPNCAAVGNPCRVIRKMNEEACYD